LAGDPAIKLLYNKILAKACVLFGANKQNELFSENITIENNKLERKRKRSQKLSLIDRQEIEKRIDKLLQIKNKEFALSRREAAIFLGMQETTLAMWKSTKRYSLPYIKMGNHVRYKISDLIDFMQQDNCITNNYFYHILNTSLCSNRAKSLILYISLYKFCRTCVERKLIFYF
jgi:hypothetical protein